MLSLWSARLDSGTAVTRKIGLEVFASARSATHPPTPDKTDSKVLLYELLPPIGSVPAGAASAFPPDVAHSAEQPGPSIALGHPAQSAAPAVPISGLNFPAGQQHPEFIGASTGHAPVFLQCGACGFQGPTSIR